MVNPDNYPRVFSFMRSRVFVFLASFAQTRVFAFSVYLCGATAVLVGLAIPALAFAGVEAGTGDTELSTLVGVYTFLTGVYMLIAISAIRSGARWKADSEKLAKECKQWGSVAYRARQSEQAVRKMSLDLACRMEERMTQEREELQRKWEAEWEERKIEMYDLAYKAALDQQKIGTLHWEDIERHLQASQVVDEGGEEG